MNDQRVVIEYEFLGYSPPDDLEAWGVVCEVKHIDGALIIPDTDLSAVRMRLEEFGYTPCNGAHPIKKYSAGQWCPTWREAWRREGKYDGLAWVARR